MYSLATAEKASVEIVKKWLNVMIAFAESIWGQANIPNEHLKAFMPHSSCTHQQPVTYGGTRVTEKFLRGGFLKHGKLGSQHEVRCTYKGGRQLGDWDSDLLSGTV